MVWFISYCVLFLGSFWTARTLDYGLFRTIVFSLTASWGVLFAIYRSYAPRRCLQLIKKLLAGKAYAADIQKLIESSYGKPPNLQYPAEAGYTGLLVYIPITFLSHTILGFHTTSFVWKLILAPSIAFPVSYLVGITAKAIASEKRYLDKITDCIQMYDKKIWENMPKNWKKQTSKNETSDKIKDSSPRTDQFNTKHSATAVDREFLLKELRGLETIPQLKTDRARFIQTATEVIQQKGPMDDTNTIIRIMNATSDNDHILELITALGSIKKNSYSNMILLSCLNGNQSIQIKSLRLLRSGSKEFTPDEFEKIYTFWKNSSGNVKHEAALTLCNQKTLHKEKLLAIAREHDKSEDIMLHIVKHLSAISDDQDISELLHTLLHHSADTVTREAKRALGIPMKDKVKPETRIKEIAPETKLTASLVLPDGYESIQCKDSSMLGYPGQGGDAFQHAIACINERNTQNAISSFQSAITLGLDPLREGYAHANLGTLKFAQGEINSAIDHFIKVFTYTEALYESVHEAAGYLGIILAETGHTEETSTMLSISARTSAKLGYSLSADIAVTVRERTRTIIT